MGLPHSDAVPPDIEGMVESTEKDDEAKKSDKDDDESEGNFVETYVDQQFKEHVQPLRDTLEEKIIKLTEVTEKAAQL